jgi:predicted RNA-binding protein with PUA domain
MEKNKRLSTRAMKSANPIDLNTVAKVALAIIQVRKEGIELYAKAIVEFMKNIHGGDWMVNIDHEGEFVVVRRLSDRAIVKSRLREAI